MQAQEQHLGARDLGESREPVREHRALPLVQLGHGGRLAAHRAREETSFVRRRKEAGDRIHDADAVATTAQGFHDLRRAGERDGALRRRAPRDHSDPHH